MFFYPAAANHVMILNVRGYWPLKKEIKHIPLTVSGLLLGALLSPIAICGTVRGMARKSVGLAGDRVGLAGEGPGKERDWQGKGPGKSVIGRGRARERA